MSDNKNTEKVQSFWVGLITTPALYIGVGGGCIVGFVLGKVFG
jgi:hypothetical protein